jgi:stage II sporulation SpoE-like protein
VIGDVAGHSPHAAATMGQLRSALRALSNSQTVEAATLIPRGDRITIRLSNVSTCFYVRRNRQNGIAVPPDIAQSPRS